MREKLVALGAMAAVAVAVSATGSACFPQGQCEGSYVDYCSPGDTTCQGALVDANHWVSGPLMGDWLDFGHERHYLMHLRDGQTGATLAGEIVDFECYVSPVKRPNVPGQQFAPAAGNLCELHVSGGDLTLDVLNDTCADYFVYVTVTSVGTGAADAGTD